MQKLTVIIIDILFEAFKVQEDLLPVVLRNFMNCTAPNLKVKKNERKKKRVVRVLLWIETGPRTKHLVTNHAFCPMPQDTGNDFK